MDKKILVIILVLAVATVSFYAGVKYKGDKTPDLEAMIRERFNRGGRSTGDHISGIRAGRFGAVGGGFATGKIISKDDQSITVKLTDADGESGSKIIFFSESTGISKIAEGASDDLVIGTQVMVTGAENEDGSITAKTIQIRPEFQRMREVPAK